MKKSILTLIASLLLFVYSCKNSSSTNGLTDTALADTAALLGVETTTDELYKWSYSEDEDKITSKKTYIAHLVSPTELNFDFPYRDAYPMLTIRKKRGETDVIIRVSEGQFKVSSMDGTKIKARFDKEVAETYSCSGASDGSSEVIFINNVTRFVKNLKAHKKLIIEAEFYSEGLKQIEYDISDLKWNH